MLRCPAPRRTRPHSSGGFTLIELLVVLAIIAILTVVAMPSIQGLLSSSNLRGSADSVIAELDLARQTASTRNLSVDVRFYQDTAKSKDNNGNFPYRLVAIVIPASVSGAATDEFLAQPLSLAGDIIVDSSTTYSSVLNTALGASGLQPTSGTELASAPISVRNLPYIKFIFLPNGTIHLDPGQQWCLTLLNQSKVAANGGPAANFVALVLDVQTSRAKVFQP